MLPIEGVTTVTEAPKLLEKAKLSFVLALRQAFASTFAHPSLRYTGNDSTNLRIFTAHPLVMEFLPCMVVSAAGGNASFGYLQDDFVEEEKSDYLQNYSGKVSFIISLTMYTSSTLERERLIDHTIFFTRHLFRDVFHGFNIEYTKDITVGGEELTEVDNKPMYSQTISVPCYLEYNVSVSQASLDEVRGVILKAVDYPNGIDIKDMDKPENADKVKTISF